MFVFLCVCVCCLVGFNENGFAIHTTIWKMINAKWKMMSLKHSENLNLNAYHVRTVSWITIELYMVAVLFYWMDNFPPILMPLFHTFCWSKQCLDLTWRDINSHATNENRLMGNRKKWLPNKRKRPFREMNHNKPEKRRKSIEDFQMIKTFLFGLVCTKQHSVVVVRIFFNVYD